MDQSKIISTDICVSASHREAAWSKRTTVVLCLSERLELEKAISTGQHQNVFTENQHIAPQLLLTGQRGLLMKQRDIIPSKLPNDTPQQLPNHLRRSLVHVIPRPRWLDHKFSLRLLRHDAAAASAALAFFCPFGDTEMTCFYFQCSFRRPPLGSGPFLLSYLLSLTNTPAAWASFSVGYFLPDYLRSE